MIRDRPGGVGKGMGREGFTREKNRDSACDMVRSVNRFQLTTTKLVCFATLSDTCGTRCCADDLHRWLRDSMSGFLFGRVLAISRERGVVKIRGGGGG